MNLGIRAILYTVRKWKKTLLIFCLLLSITTLVLSGLAIVDAQEEQAEEVRGTTGASFTVERDISTGGWTSGYSTQEFMTDDMIKEIAAVDGIAGYDASLITLPRFFNDKGEAFVTVENFSYIISATGDSKAQSKARKGKIVHGTKSIMVLIAVKILFFIIVLSPFCLPKTEAGNAQANNGDGDCHGYPREKLYL